MIHDSKHDIFIERFKRLLKEKKYTYEKFSEEMGYSVEAIKSWMRKKGNNFPNMSTLVRISELLDCDVSYLLGEQQCRRIKSQRLTDLIGVSEAAADKLLNGNIPVNLFSQLIESDYFEKLLWKSQQYCYSQYADLQLNDISELIADKKVDAKSVLKYGVTDLFGKILEEIYSKNETVSEYAVDMKLLTALFKYINSYYSYKWTTISKEDVMSHIDNSIKGLSSSHFNILKKMKPEDFLNNYKTIADTLDINYQE